MFTVVIVFVTNREKGISQLCALNCCFRKLFSFGLRIFTLRAPLPAT